MIITYETTLKDFKFWGLARENAAKLTDEEWKILEMYFEDELWEQTRVNDYFAYYFGGICEILGLTEEEVLARD